MKFIKILQLIFIAIINVFKIIVLAICFGLASKLFAYMIKFF